MTDADSYPWAMGGYISQESCNAQVSNSKYLPVPVCENLRQLSPGNLLVVGTPCQLLAMEAFYRSTKVRLIKICILCKQQKTFNFSRFMAKRLGVTDYKSVPIQYRGDGWPGKIAIGTKKMCWEEAAALPYSKRLWSVPGCFFCTHPLGSNADLTLADPWKIMNTKQSGMTMILIRTEAGEKLLDLSCKEIALQSIDSDRAKLSVDWQGIQAKQKRTKYYLSKSLGGGTRLKFKVGDFQRASYEWLLLSLKLPELALKVLNRMPYWG
ncbi:Coenzyme F420 hydrogenase/dehydrogenase, beta subunit C-terminal domain [Syntrophus gentianae]|nr:Coenzyme F420 hydrogenase/dehydrogenase, beta subunit C-terminal domain [Syntrophus gentianae]